MSIIENKKKCSECKEIKPRTTEFFYKSKAILKSQCKECLKEKRKKRHITEYPRNLDKRNEKY